MQWYLSVLKNYVGFSGRARRKEYWMFTLINAIVGAIINVIQLILGLELPYLSMLLFCWQPSFPSLRLLSVAYTIPTVQVPGPCSFFCSVYWLARASGFFLSQKVLLAAIVTETIRSLVQINLRIGTIFRPFLLTIINIIFR